MLSIKKFFKNHRNEKSHEGRHIQFSEIEKATNKTLVQYADTFKKLAEHDRREKVCN